MRSDIGGRDRARTGDPLLAKQVLSQLSYTPTVEVTFILKHLQRFQNPLLRIFVTTVPELLVVEGTARNESGNEKVLDRPL
jgi:hypothetical protein